MKLMFLKNDCQCFGMRKRFVPGLLLMVFIGLQACTFSEPEKKKERPMVYEGMPIEDLTIVLGTPDSIQSGGSVYNADLSKTQKVEKWYFDTRTVVVIDDTVKTPNMNER